MTIGLINRNEAVGNGSTAVYSYNFKIFAATHLQVSVLVSGVETILTYATHYTVSGVGAAAGGSITLIDSAAFSWMSGGKLKTGVIIVIRRLVPVLQGTDVKNQGDFRAAIHEDSFDYLTMIDQQQQDEIDRSIKVNVTTDVDPIDMSLPAPVAGGFLRVTVLGTAFEWIAASLSDLSQFIQSGTGAVVRTWLAKVAEAVSPEDFGALGNGTTDDKAAMLLALQTGRIVDGNGRTYGISGTMQPSTFKALRNANLKQLAPGSVGIKTLHIVDKNDWFLSNVSVDCGDDRNDGNSNNNAGIWVDISVGTSKRWWMDNVEVKNGGPMNGFAIWNSSEFSMKGCVSRDFIYNLSPDPTDDVINGYWFNVCSNFTLVDCRALRLTGFLLAVASKRYTRGFTFGGCTQFAFSNCLVDTADQGYDLTGSAGNEQFAISNCVAADCGTGGFEFKNSAHHGTVTGCISADCGRYGFHVSGMTEGPNPLVRDITFSNCLAWNIGSSGLWVTERRGFYIEAKAAVDISYPRNIKFVGCNAIDTQGSPTMDHGFVNDVVAISPTSSGYNADHTNTLVNCRSRGPAAFQSGFHFPVCSLTDDDAQSIANNTWTAITWDSELIDPSAMHSTSTNPGNVYIKEAGYYLAAAHIVFATNATGDRRARILLNGVQVAALDIQPGHATITPTCHPSVVIYCVPGDALRVEAYQDSGGNLDVIRQLPSNFYVTKTASS